MQLTFSNIVTAVHFCESFILFGVWNPNFFCTLVPYSEFQMPIEGHWVFPTCNAEDVGRIPGLGRSPRGGHDNPLQYSCLENPMGRGAWEAVVHGPHRRVRYDWATKHAGRSKFQILHICSYRHFSVYIFSNDCIRFRKYGNGLFA